MFARCYIALRTRCPIRGESYEVHTMRVCLLRALNPAQRVFHAGALLRARRDLGTLTLTIVTRDYEIAGDRKN